MKRMITLAVLAAFVIGFATTASAIVDVKASGSWRAAAIWGSNFDFLDDDTNGQEAFDVAMRARTTFQFIANENLRGVWQIEIGTADWGIGAGNPGAAGHGLQIGGDDPQLIETKSLFVDFTIPNTQVQIMAGLLPLALPGGFAGSPVLDDDMCAAVLSTPLFDGVSLLAGWGRAFDTVLDANDNGDDNVDALFAAVPMSFDWLTLAPYVAYVYAGENFLNGLNGQGDLLRAGSRVAGLLPQGVTAVAELDNDVDVWYLGMAAGLNLDPVVINAHLVYGDSDISSSLDRSGWEADIALTYTGFDFVTPQAWFVWTSGEDDDDSDGSERLPVISDGFTPGNFYFGGGIIGDGFDSIHGGSSDIGMGYWGIGLDLTDISFIANLTHELGIAYFKGTNDEDMGTDVGPVIIGANTGISSAYGSTLTDDDSIVEYYFGTNYQMYDQLVLMLKAAYLDVDFDGDVWGGLDDEDAGILEIGLSYDF